MGTETGCGSWCGWSWGCDWRGRGRCFCCPFLFVGFGCCGGLVLLEIALDEAGVLFDLVFCDAHLFEILQHVLHSRVCQINPACVLGLTRGRGRLGTVAA